MFLTVLVGLRGSVNWLLVGGDVVSDPDDSLIEKPEAGDLGCEDLGTGLSCKEKNRDSELELRPGEASLGRPEVDSGRLGRGSSSDWSPGAL